MIYLILAEAALELIPKQLLNHPTIQAYSRKVGKSAGKLLLDSCYHHGAMKKIPNWEKRGRPDIVHVSLLTALDSPLNLSGNLRTYLHTINSEIIEINSSTRVPRSYHRFTGVFEQLFLDGKLKTETELLTLKIFHWKIL